MSKETIHVLNTERRSCGCCGAEDIRMSFETERFNYKTENGEVVELSAQVPVWACPNCDEQYTDERAEDIRHAAVCQYLGRLTPAEIRRLREGINLSQSQWADLTGVGIASVKRWETGSLIQGLAMDRYFRLLRDERNVTALQRMLGLTREPGRPHFRTDLPAAAIEQAAIFKLRLGRAA
ncbi:MAG TPA: type II TA system antitoxin MqsA family protein [Xanthobacteraceae bacterium]